MQPIIRRVGDQDIHAVASIHAASWRSAYRGMLLDSFLDADLLRNRISLWSRRLTPIPQGHFGYLALAAGRPIGFAFAFGAQDPQWGTQIDNLHVLPESTGQGIGKRLLLTLGEHATSEYPGAGLYLWVYERNSQARRFYESLGAEAIERAVIQAPGGGEVAEWRYAWRRSASLVLALRN